MIRLPGTALLALAAMLLFAPAADAAPSREPAQLTFSRSVDPVFSDDCVCLRASLALWGARLTARPRPHALRICGSRGRRLCTGASPAWSPDGRRLAIEMDRKDKPSALAVVVPARGRTTILTGLTEPMEPAWSPDGRKLAVTTQSSIREPAGGTSFGTAIFVVDVASGRTRRLTRGLGASAPDWSSRGRIAFQRAAPDGDTDVLVIRADGSGLREIAADAADPAWSPGGREIAFVRPVGTGEDLFAARLRDGATRRLTSPGSSARPAWSPDGRWIAYEDDGAVRAVSADGARRRTIARPGYAHAFGDPAWRALRGDRQRRRANP